MRDELEDITDVCTGVSVGASDGAPSGSIPMGLIIFIFKIIIILSKGSAWITSYIFTRTQKWSILPKNEPNY